MSLLKWLFFPAFLVLRMGGGGGGGGGANTEVEEARKNELRRKIDALYGIDSSAPATAAAPAPAGDRPGAGELIKAGLATPKNLDPARTVMGSVKKLFGGGGKGFTFRTDIPGLTTPGEDFSGVASGARASLEAENTKLADATRAYYTDQLGKTYNEASRNTRFKLARQGLLGGSEDVYQQGDVTSDRDLGATRVDEAVRRAIASLTGQREQERLSAIGLVNSGAGDSAVSAAQAGLRNSLENVSSAQKADLFGDLFANSADAVTANNIAGNEAALAARFRDRLGSFFPVRTTTGGRVTPSA